MYTPKFFSATTVTKAIKACKNCTAPRADGLNIFQLKHLGPFGTQYLTPLYNLSYEHATLPAIWKQATILPLLKPGKPQDRSTSYGPMSLLCPASKVLGKLMLQCSSPHFHLSKTQHGFRSGRSTTTVLLSLVHQFASGFQSELSPPQDSGDGRRFFEGLQHRQPNTASPQLPVLSHLTISDCSSTTHGAEMRHASTIEWSQQRLFSTRECPKAPPCNHFSSTTMSQPIQILRNSAPAMPMALPPLFLIQQWNHAAS